MSIGSRVRIRRDAVKLTREHFPAPSEKPSSGLEPETPSLPWNDSGNGSQPTATVSLV